MYFSYKENVEGGEAVTDEDCHDQNILLQKTCFCAMTIGSTFLYPLSTVAIKHVHGTVRDKGRERR